jgi:dTDP-4-amino-4,6-dideoxygalactose transaminase
MLRWFGVGPGDEVIVPAYTYSATANVVEHCGAKVVFADVKADDFNINPGCIKKLITSNTKVIMPVDFAGWPCDFEAINTLVASPDVKALCKPKRHILSVHFTKGSIPERSPMFQFFHFMR